MPAAITNIAIPAVNSKYFRNSMVVLLSILLRVFGKLRRFRAARECHADDLSEDEFFDQQRRGQRESQAADDYQTLQHRFHDYPPCPRRKKMQAGSQSELVENNEVNY